MIEESHFEEVVNYFKVSILSNNHWESSEALYDLLDIKQKKFDDYVPKHMEKDVFVTIIGFVIVCFHESTRLVHHNRHQEKLQEEKDKLQRKKKRENMTHYQKEKDFEDEVNKLSMQEGFKT